MLKVAIVGTGYIAVSAHIPAFLSLGDQVELVAGVARSPEKSEKKLKEFGIHRVYTDMAEMLSAEHPDIVAICTPNVSHERLSKMALSAGADVLCEKPVAMTLAGAEEMYALAKKNHCLLMACQTQRFQPAWQRAKELVDEGLLGEIYSAEARWTRRRGIPTWGSFHLKEENGGGALCDIGVHLLDGLFWLLGTKSVPVITGRMGSQLKDTLPATAWNYQRGGHFRPEEMDVEEWAMGSLVTDNGVVANFHFAWATNGPQELKLLLNGTKGSLSVPDLTFYPAVGEPVQIACTKEATSKNGHTEMVRQYFEAKKNGTRLPVLPEETLLVTKVIEDFYRQQKNA